MTSTRGPVEIVLTGGPCAGKTTALRYLVEHLSGRGWRALVVPEAATLMITGGLHDVGALAANDRARYLAVQEHLLSLQHDLRRRFHALAAALDAEKTVILYDRAELDNRAYMEPAEFDTTLRSAVNMVAGAVAAQYDAVIHLVTAADGLHSYTTANNEARFETPQQAVELDRAVQAAWLGHPHYVVVGNDRSFDQKLTRTLAAVLNVLGEPEPLEIERKWLLSAAPPTALLAGAVPVDIEQMYLPPDGQTERRIRARTHDGHITYFHTTKTPKAGSAGRVEREQIITAETYHMLAGMRWPSTEVIRKRRFCFVRGSQHFELDHLTEPVDAWLLEAELITADTEVTVPAELAIAGEVTADPRWRNATIARTPAFGKR